MRRPLFAAALFLVIVAAIRLKAGWADFVQPDHISARDLTAYETLCVTGQVYQKDETSIYLKSVILWDSNAFGQSAVDLRQKISLQENLICETDQALTIPLGSTVTVSGDFYAYSQATNPGEFDSAVYYRTLGIGGRLKKAVVRSRGTEYWHIREWLFWLKTCLRERLYRIFPEKEAAVMSALLLGDKTDLDSELKDLYKRNGILHILSISSLHITIIGMSVYKLFRRMGAPICPAAAVGSVILILYGCMTGFSVSACRAIGMYLIKMLAEAVGRTYDMLTALGVMAALMVIQNPYYLQSSGFLLSFASVLGLGVVYPALMPEISPGASAMADNSAQGRFSEILRKILTTLSTQIRQSFIASLSITLATLPIQLWFYYEVPVYSVFLNLVVIPFLKPMMITGILAMAAPGLGVLGGMDTLILRGYEFLCGCFDRLPFHTWNPGCPRLWQVVIFYMLLTGAVLVGNRRKDRKNADRKNMEKKNTDRKNADKKNTAGRIRKVFCGSAVVKVCMLCLGVWVMGFRPPLENSVTFLDIGQGDCIIVRTASGQTYLFDCGSSSRSSVGKYVLIPYLKYNGIHTIDAMFLSHPDADHVNGAVELLSEGGENHITVIQLVLPAIDESARQEQLGELLDAAANASQSSPVPVGYLSAGDSWDCGSAVFTCLHPEEGFRADDANAYSECLLVEFYDSHGSWAGGRNAGNEWTLLLTGDAENEGEAALLREIRARGIAGITVLKVAHHGSRNSTPEEMLEQLNPALSVISSGRNNRYGHPHAELLERLQESGTYIMQTAQSGAITLTFRNGSLRATAFIPGGI